MLIGMMGLGWDAFAAAPNTSGLVISALLLAIGAGALWYGEQHVAPKRPQRAGTSGALRRESPAVVNMLTNDATLTASGLRATVIDLAARGWLRLLPHLMMTISDACVPLQRRTRAMRYSPTNAWCSNM